jgi:hypothetical protein
MNALTLHNADRVITFTKVNEHTTKVRSGWTRKPNAPVNWYGNAKHMARFQAIAYVRQLEANGWSRNA